MIDIKEYGYKEAQAPQNGLLPARITEQHRTNYMAICAYGEVQAILKGTLLYEANEQNELPCVGDFVWLRFNDSGPSLINNLIPRRSWFSRADFSGHKAGYAKTILEQMVAANFDFVFIVTSLNRDFRISRIMRYLTQARQSGGAPVIILTKADLVAGFDEQINAVREVAADIPVHAVSSHTGFGLKELNQYMEPTKTIVFLGMSGVGKSSLLNALADDKLMAVSETRSVDESKGSHTTTHRQLFMLPNGTMIIDTPGMRELGLLDSEEGISEGFSDVEDLFTQCRFNDCRHKTEPGCAVLTALENGSLTHEQWERYLAQTRENKYVDDKAGFMRERHAEYKKWKKGNRKNGGFK